MNDPKMFQFAWAAFAVGGLSGSYLGWRQNNIAQKQRFIDNVEITRKRNEKLDALEIRMRNKGIILQEKGHHGTAKKIDQDMFKIPVVAEFDKEPDGGDFEIEITDTELHENEHDREVTEKIEIYHDRNDKV